MTALWGAMLLFAMSPPELAYKHLNTLPAEERVYTRYLAYPKANEKRVRSMRFWQNNLHLESSPSFATEVPDSEGTLYYFDLREFGWTPEAWSAVAQREPYFREPYVDGDLALLIRKKIYINTKGLHIELVVRADWFFRETFESDRSPSYYDLLYARFRFKGGKVFVGKSDGLYLTEEPSKFEKFPKNEADFEKVFAVDKFREHLKEFKIDTRHGAVVEGMEKGISIVARQNRLIERIITSAGSYYKTYDVRETSGKRDFAETLNKDFEFDAGEILTDLPAGGMAALLVNADGSIVETADNRFATDMSDLRYDARVRTPGSCFICHEQKFIKPQNLIEEMMKKGVDIKFKKKADLVAARGFFLDWIDKLETEQTRFERFIARTSGYKPGLNALYLKEWRDEYDAPVDLEKAIIESYMSREEFIHYAKKSTKARIANLLAGISMPRKTWEVDGYKEMQLLRAAGRK